MTGVSAALLAQKGFTGAPAVTVEYPKAALCWESLGTTWGRLARYVKPHAVCRWAQPAIEAAVDLQRRYQLQPEDIAAFLAGTRCANRATGVL